MDFLSTGDLSLNEAHSDKFPKTKINDEKHLFNKLISLLSGIPPPPSVATCNLSCGQLLESFQLNNDLQWSSITECKFTENNPRVFYLNSHGLSEDIADLSAKLQARFVQSETASSYSIKDSRERQILNARQKKPWNGISPGRRLSHLAKRRQMFSKANLQQMSKNEPKAHRLAISRPSNSKQRNLAKEYLEYKDATSKDRSLPKRALFQSPEDDTLPGLRTIARNVPRRRLFDKPDKLAQLPQGGGSYDVSGWLATQPFVGGKKRSREECRDSDRKRRCPRRSLDFSEGSPSQGSDASGLSHGASQAHPSVTLTQVHKQKLLWAVAVALKEKKITHKDSRFKQCATNLFSACKKNLTLILSLSITGGTSQKMLTYAREQVDDIISNVVQPVEGNSNTSGILLDLSPSTLNKKHSDLASTNIINGKENASETPKRKIRERTWQTCIKSNRKSRLRLCRSISFDDLQEINQNQANLSLSRFSPIKMKVPCKRKRDETFNNCSTALDESVDLVHSGLENRDSIAENTIVEETPEKLQNCSDCVPGSQEEVQIQIFPALTRNRCQQSICERSPDLFELDDECPNNLLQETEEFEKGKLFQNLGETDSTRSHQNFSDCASDIPTGSNCLLPICQDAPDDSDEVFDNGKLIRNVLLSNMVEVGENAVANVACSNSNDENFKVAPMALPVVLTELISTDNDCVIGMEKSLDEKNEADLADVQNIIFSDFHDHVEQSSLLPNSTLGFTNDIKISMDEEVNKCVLLTSEMRQTLNPAIDCLSNCIRDESVVRLDEGHCTLNSNFDGIAGKEIDEVQSMCGNDILSPKDSSNNDFNSQIEDEDENNKSVSSSGDENDWRKTNDTVGDFSVIKNVSDNDNVYVNDEGSDDDKQSSNICTSTPLALFPKKLKIRSRPAWRLEAGPGLKIRMRLSKDWDIVEKSNSHMTDSPEVLTSNIDLDVELKPAETQTNNSLLRRVCYTESSGTSMESYTLTEIRDRLAIEKTLNAENSDLSLFSSDSSIDDSTNSETVEKSEESMTEDKIDISYRRDYSDKIEEVSSGLEDRLQSVESLAGSGRYASHSDGYDAKDVICAKTSNILMSYLIDDAQLMLPSTAIVSPCSQKSLVENSVENSDDEVHGINHLKEDHHCEDDDDMPLIMLAKSSKIEKETEFKTFADNIDGGTSLNDNNMALEKWEESEYELSESKIESNVSKVNAPDNDKNESQTGQLPLNINVPLISLKSDGSKVTDGQKVLSLSDIPHENKSWVNEPDQVSVKSSVDDDNIPLIHLISENSRHGLIHRATSIVPNLPAHGISNNTMPLDDPYSLNPTLSEQSRNARVSIDDINDDLPLSQLAHHQYQGPNFRNNGESEPNIYSPNNKYRDTAPTENEGLQLAKDDSNTKIDDECNSSSEEDLPLCQLFSHKGSPERCNNKLTDASEEDDNLPLIQLTKSAQKAGSNVERASRDGQVSCMKYIHLEDNPTPEFKTEREKCNQTPTKESSVTDDICKTLTKSGGSDTSGGSSKIKLSFESYKARKKLIMQPVIDEEESPKVIYNIRLKKRDKSVHKEKRRHRRKSSSNDTWEEAIDDMDKLVREKAKTFVDAFSTISCVVQQEMKITVSAITDNEEKERKLRKLSNVSAMSENILQSFFEQLPITKSVFTSDS